MENNELNIPLIQNIDLKNKIVLVRVDHNVVKKGVIHDPYRIDSTIATLYNIVAKGGKLILMTHVGRPKNKKSGEITISNDSSVEPIVEYLNNKLSIKLIIPEFVKHGTDGYVSINTSVNHLIKDLKESKIDGIYLPNTRWFKGEESQDDKFANQLAGLADIYVNDAFGSWQPHSSTFGITKFLPSYAGLLMQKELKNLSKIYNPTHPFVTVVAGSKFDTKIDSLNALIKTSDYLILGGVIYNAYISAKYGVSIKGISEEDIDSAKKFVEFTKQFPNKLVELPYIIESDELENKKEGNYRVRNIHDLKQGDKLNYVLDIAKESFEDETVKKIFRDARTIFVNAVMGFVPNFSEGTFALDSIIDKNGEAMKLFGGGDTLQEFKRLLPGLYLSALDNPKYYLFTGGGAVLKAIQEGSPMGLAPVLALTK